MQKQEVNQLMLNHVKKVIFQENESRTLKGLLEDYNNLLTNYNFHKCERTSGMKTMLEKEFGESIGFHNRLHKNESCIIYDVSKGGSYIEAAINTWGISDDDLLRNVAGRLKEKTKHFTNLKWPPHPNHLENLSTIPEDFIKFLTWLRHPSRKPEECSMDDPKIVALGDLLLAYIGNK